MKQIKYKYIVWINARPEYYVKYEDALETYKFFKSIGYDDVQLFGRTRLR